MIQPSLVTKGQHLLYLHSSRSGGNDCGGETSGATPDVLEVFFFYWS